MFYTQIISHFFLIVYLLSTIFPKKSFLVSLILEGGVVNPCLSKINPLRFWRRGQISFPSRTLQRFPFGPRTTHRTPPPSPLLDRCCDNNDPILSDRLRLRFRQKALCPFCDTCASNCPNKFERTLEPQQPWTTRRMKTIPSRCQKLKCAISMDGHRLHNGIHFWPNRILALRRLGIEHWTTLRIALLSRSWHIV